MRSDLLGGVLLILLSFWLFANEHHEIATVSLLAGASLALYGGHRYLKSKPVQHNHETLIGRWPDIAERFNRGETPDQIAQAFERDHQIPPSTTLYFVARATLDFIERAPTSANSFCVTCKPNSPRSTSRVSSRSWRGRSNHPAALRCLGVT